MNSQRPNFFCSSHFIAQKQLMESYLLLVCLLTPPPAIRLSGAAEGASPRSAGVLSSTDWEIRLQRTSVAARRPLTMGVAAVKAIMMGARTANLVPCH